jgi:hypothetical protein
MVAHNEKGPGTVSWPFRLTLLALPDCALTCRSRQARFLPPDIVLTCRA